MNVHAEAFAAAQLVELRAYSDIALHVRYVGAWDASDLDAMKRYKDEAARRGLAWGTPTPRDAFTAPEVVIIDTERFGTAPTEGRFLVMTPCDDGLPSVHFAELDDARSALRSAGFVLHKPTTTWLRGPR